jgi:maleylpyruvate isomerase
MTKPEARLDDVYAATALYLRTVDKLSPEDLPIDTVLPGWSRAHVVAHVALHALGASRALTGLVHERALPMYDSQEQRDADIDATAKLPPDELRELSFDACGRFKAACEAIHETGQESGRHYWDETIERIPGGNKFSASGLVDARWREVEIHHADLGAGYEPGHWSPDFTAYIFDQAVHDRGGQENLLLRTPTGDVPVGEGTGQTIEGQPAALAYWLLGRHSGHGLPGDIPTLGPWTPRTTAK